MSHGVTCLLNAERGTRNAEFEFASAARTFSASHSTTVAGGEEPGPQAEFHRVKPGSSISRQPREAEIFAIARPIVIKEILALSDVPDPRAFTRYLNTLSFSDLCARRDQQLIEKQEQLKAEELRRQPELPERPLRQQRLFFGGSR